jgi:molybdenum cofactor cytidylyltransferase
VRYNIVAVIVAAGLSRRMGAFKLTLPWGDATVIESIVATLAQAHLAETVVVTGHRSGEVERCLASAPVRCAHNPRYESHGMLSSVQTGLRDIIARHNYTQAPGADERPQIVAALLCLGDQPQMELATVEAVLAEGERTGWQRVIIPSYRMRAGHPILIPSSLWPQIMNTSESLRDVLRSRADLVDYMSVDTDSILADLDTPEDYARATAPRGE